MANEKGGYSAKTMTVVIVVVLVVGALVMWLTGAFTRLEAPPNTREVYKTDTKDLSGGKLIVTDQTPAVPVDVPTTRMTNVPPGQAAPSATASPSASPTGK
jgi:hypothetical protein